MNPVAELNVTPRTRQVLRAVAFALIGVAVAASIRRLVALADPLDGAPSVVAGLDALFAAKAKLTRAHVVPGLVLALVIPVQLSPRVRGRFPTVHRWVGRVALLDGVIVGLTGYAM